MDLPDMLQGLGSLALVLLAILALPWMLRRLTRFPGRSAGRMQVVTALPVGPRERLVLVQVGAEQLLLGVAPGQVRLLRILPAPLTDDETPAVGPGEDFGTRLGAAMKQWRNGQ